MEHLSLPQDASLNSTDKVRYVSTEAYDRGPFLEYATRNPRLKQVDSFGEDIKPSRGVKTYFKKHAKALEDLFQTWLFFGLLHEFLGEDMRDEDFVDPEKKSIDTSRLVDLTRQRSSIWAQASDKTKRQLSDCLRRTYDMLYATMDTDFDENIRFSIASSAELLDRALLYYMPGNVGIRWSVGFWTQTRALSMKHLGWCPYEATRLQTSRLSLNTLFYLSKMRKAASARDHSNCAADLCLFFEKAKRDLAYSAPPQHRETDCSCAEVAPAHKEMSLMRDLLERGQVPLVRVNLDSAGEPSLQVVEQSEPTRYVAISHVSADGLGSTTTNALPGCQLLYLQGLLTSLEKNISPPAQNHLALWIDTLCVPVSPKRAKERAFSVMRKAFEDADHVLVLDAEMKNIHNQQIPVIEQSARLLTSTWMLRLWTLQEGCLAKNLWIQFASGAVEVRKIYDELKIAYDNITKDRRAIYREFLSAFRVLREELANKENLDVELIATAMENRHVTDPSDESLCIAVLFDIDAGMVYSVPTAERMRVLWYILAVRNRGVPKSIIFHDGNKLQYRGFQWAPSTLLNLGTGMPPSLGQPQDYGVPVSSGLLVHFPGAGISVAAPPRGLEVDRVGLANPSMIWTAPEGRKFESLFVRDFNGSWLRLLTPLLGLSDIPIADGTTTPRQNSGGSEHGAAGLYEMLQKDPNRYAIILRGDKVPNGWAMHQGESSEGILVEKINEEEDMAIVQNLRNVQLQYQGAERSSRLEVALTTSQAIAESSELKNYASSLSSSVGAADSHIYLRALQKAIHELLQNKPFTDTQAEKQRLAGMVFETLLGRFAILEAWSDPQRPWIVD